jgi:putative DNA primase/helicase
MAQNTHGFFRRFKIIPFDVIIAKEEQDPYLEQKICAVDLPAIFNMALAALQRLMNKQQFTESDIVNNRLNQYQLESNSVAMFVGEEGWQPSHIHKELLKLFYEEYQKFCTTSGYRCCTTIKFAERLRNLGYEVVAGSANKRYVWYEKKPIEPETPTTNVSFFNF